MNRTQINRNIRRTIINYILHYSKLPTRQAIEHLANSFSVPKQVISGNISWLVRSNQVNIIRCKPNSYLY